MLPDRDAQCPERGPGLSHVQDGSVECEYCGTRVFGPRRRRQARPVAVPAPVETTFTDDEFHHIDFLRWLRVHGRI